MHIVVRSWSIQRQLERNMPALSDKQCPRLREKLFKICRSSVVKQSWLRILYMVCSYVMTMFKRLSPSLNTTFLYAAGVLYEKTMSYKVPFILAGGAFVTSGLLSLFISRQHCAKLMKHADSSDTDSSQVTDTH